MTNAFADLETGCVLASAMSSLWLLVLAVLKKIGAPVSLSGHVAAGVRDHVMSSQARSYSQVLPHELSGRRQRSHSSSCTGQTVVGRSGGFVLQLPAAHAPHGEASIARRIAQANAG